MALVCRHFGLSGLEVELHLPWHLWLPYLAVALDLEEIEQYRVYCTSGGKPDDFKWTSPDHAGTREPGPVGVQATLMQMAAEVSGGHLKKSDVWEYGKAIGARKVVQAYERDDRTGEILRKVFVDADTGEIVEDTEGYRFISSQHAEAKQAAERIFGTG